MNGNSTGFDNTAIGSSANVNANNYHNCTMLGRGAIGTASNQVRVGDVLVTSIGGYANWTNISDKRVKKNIKTNVPGLNFINKLNPVTYNLDLEASDLIIQSPKRMNKSGKAIQFSEEELMSKKKKEQIFYTGLIAQEVETVAKSIGFDFSGVDVPKNDKDLYGLRYAEFVVPLVKAVQELSAQNDKLKTENEQMQSELTALVKRIAALELTKQVYSNNNLLQPEIINDIARLEQNSPNPFNANTIIRYYIPEKSSNAKVSITDFNGRVVKDNPINNKGAGQITINARFLAAGNYVYTLFVDGLKADTKQMVLTK